MERQHSPADFNVKNIFQLGTKILISVIILNLFLAYQPVYTINPAFGTSINRAMQANTSNSTSSTNCTVDSCIKCVDNTSLTCTDCDSGFYKKTFRGGAKSYNVCWKVWKLLLAILGGLCLTCCLSACCYYCYQRGKAGKGIFSKRPMQWKKNKGQTVYNDGPVRQYQPQRAQQYVQTQPSPRAIQRPAP